MKKAIDAAFGRRVLAAIVVLAVMATACGDQGPGDPRVLPAGERLQIVTTVAPITSIVANVAGDLATITGLVPEGTNSHTFEPPPSAAKALSRADIVFTNGLRLEEPTRDLAAKNQKKGSEIVELGTLAITPDEYIYDFSFPEDEGKPNPHLWTHPPLGKQYARIAADTMKRRDPTNADAYEANYSRFAARIDAFDKAVTAATATLAPERRKLLTYHDAYAYFARDYGWKVIGAIQVSDFEDPTPKEVVRLIEQVRQTRVPAIFGSEVFPSPVLAQIGKEAKVRYVDVLRDDDLPGQPGQARHSWLGLMHFDYVTMTEALGGNAAALKRFKPRNVAPDRATYPQ